MTRSTRGGRRAALPAARGRRVVLPAAFVPVFGDHHLQEKAKNNQNDAESVYSAVVRRHLQQKGDRERREKKGGKKKGGKKKGEKKRKKKREGETRFFFYLLYCDLCG